MLFWGINMQVPSHSRAALLLSPILIINIIMASGASMHTGAETSIYWDPGACKCHKMLLQPNIRIFRPYMSLQSVTMVPVSVSTCCFNYLLP